jgi:predicted Zn-ribbon and HTH transcriptional regulator
MHAGCILTEPPAPFNSLDIELGFFHAIPYDECLMLPPELTPRQRIIDVITGTRLSSYQLAQMLGIRERQVEEHLTHVVKTVAQDKTKRFILEPSRCQDCDYVFRERRRLTRPSRCPNCRSEGIAAPRYGIDSVRSETGRANSTASSL